MKQFQANPDVSLNDMLASVNVGESCYQKTMFESTNVEGIHNGWIVTKKFNSDKNVIVLYIPK